MKRRFTRCIAVVLLLTMLLPILFGCTHDHSFGEWETVEEATCTADGIQIRICNCGEFEKRDIKALNHKAGQWETIQEATEKENGRMEAKCEHCGALVGYKIIPALGMNVSAQPSKDKTYYINIMTQRSGDYAYENDVADLWFFQYIEYWFAQQGYDVRIYAQQSNDIEQTKKLMLATDTIPDIVWGVELTNDEIVRYAIGESCILEWTSYINEALMPNLSRLFAEQPESKILSTAVNGGIYGIPYYAPAQYSADFFAPSQRLYFRQSWLDAVGIQNPTTKEELLAVLRAFKTKITDQTAYNNDVPLVSADGLLEQYLWSCMGYYGNEPNRYGSGLMMKDETLVVPAYTESYRDFVTLMKTLYDEDLISKNFFHHTSTNVHYDIIGNRCGAMSSADFTYFGENFSDIVCANPIPMGDVTTVEDIHVSSQQAVTPNYIWANSRYEDPRILAMLIDFIYSEEGASLYYYGPKQGEDPLGLVDGWYYDENGNVTTAKVADATYVSMDDYVYTCICPNNYVGLRPAAVTSGSGTELEFTDSVTGSTYTCKETVALSHDTNNGHGQLITIEKWADRTTMIHIPDVSLSSDDKFEYLDFKNAINTWIESETVKFITGVRPIQEVDQFWKELEDLGIEEYLVLAEQGLDVWLSDTYQ